MNAMCSSSLPQAALPKALASFIETRDRKIAKFWDHSPTHNADLFTQLLKRGSVLVGGRSSCGCTDPSMSALRLWNEVVSKARKHGFEIVEHDRPQTNAWATASGGFWNESEYQLIRSPNQTEGVSP